MRPAFILLVGCLLLPLSPAFPSSNDSFTTTHLAQKAKAYERVAAAGGKGTGEDLGAANYFTGYVNAIADLSAVDGSLCAPSGVTYSQLWSVVAKYLRENPQQWHGDPHRVVQMALVTNFPCPATKRSGPK